MAELPKNTFVTNAIDSTKSFMAQHWKMAALGLVGIISLGIVWFMVRSYFNQKLKERNELGEEEPDPETCEFIYFYTEWCPYCKKTDPVWHKFESDWKGKTIKGYTIQTSKLDCDKNEAVANRYNVINYPTIKCIMNGKVTEFDAKPTTEALNQFVQACLN